MKALALIKSMHNTKHTYYTCICVCGAFQNSGPLLGRSIRGRRKKINIFTAYPSHTHIYTHSHARTKKAKSNVEKMHPEPCNPQGPVAILGHHLRFVSESLPPRICFGSLPVIIFMEANAHTCVGLLQRA